MTQSAQPVASTGLFNLDTVLPAFEPGHLWVIVGPRGIGVTELSLSVVRHAGRATGSARVLISNLHLTARRTSERLGAAPAADVVVIDGLPLPVRGGAPAWATSAGVAAADLVVYDTIDETEEVDWAPSRDEAVHAMRELRSAARLQQTAVLGTFRVAPEEFDIAGVTRAWCAHPWHEAVVDSADVILILAAARVDPYVDVVVDSRHSGPATATLRQDRLTGRFS